MSRNHQIFLMVVVAFAFVLQLSVIPQLNLLSVAPDLILVVAVVVAVQEGPIAGAIVGFAGGMLQDIASPQVMGMSALTKALAAFTVGMMKDLFMTYSILLPVLLVFLATVFEILLHHGALIILGQEQLPPFKLDAVFAESFFNVFAVLIVYPFIRRFKFLQKDESVIFARPNRR
ncbi:MAG: rod shape-determining protein MreD [Candidatus Anoxymicrobium japonicum]|uniref:Rod shape-determining protein MreD n=1 Tax=Candidatus Anoxymicrobium japonicum TaxID=2013648 RepID=A0A2N3G7L8_9ACTN|nr:MAG: rod shape-determining protein MreD [Candidatus Anoxymicrobium japonicum]